MLDGSAFLLSIFSEVPPVSLPSFVLLEFFTDMVIFGYLHAMMGWGSIPGGTLGSTELFYLGLEKDFFFVLTAISFFPVDTHTDLPYAWEQTRLSKWEFYHAHSLDSRFIFKGDNLTSSSWSVRLSYSKLHYLDNCEPPRLCQLMTEGSRVRSLRSRSEG